MKISETVKDFAAWPGIFPRPAEPGRGPMRFFRLLLCFSLLPIALAARADVIPGGTYKGNDADVQTVTVSALWVSRSNVPEDLHYGVVKGLFGNKKAGKILANGHAKGKTITLETHSVGVPIPYCAGAAKFYKEAGVYKEPAKP